MRLVILLLGAFILISGCVQQTVPEPPVTTGTVKSLNPVCTELEGRINSLLAVQETCTVDSDCKVGYLGSCEFGCFLSLTTGEDPTPITSLVNQFKELKCPTCAVRCGSVDQVQPTCVGGTCILVSN